MAGNLYTSIWRGFQHDDDRQQYIEVRDSTTMGRWNVRNITIDQPLANYDNKLLVRWGSPRSYYMIGTTPPGTITIEVRR